MSVESNSTTILVAAGKWHKIELFAEVCSRSDRAALAGFQAGNVSAELGIYHGYLTVLDDIEL